MELRHLRYFVTVAEAGSLSGAAEKLFISQPPLSTQIKQLEHEIGTPLFIRQSRGILLTAAGTRFLKEAKEILEHSERAKALARQADNPRGGLIRIGFVPSASHTVLPRFMKQLRRQRPEIEVIVRELVTAEQLLALDENRIDVGIARPSASARYHAWVAQQINDPLCLAIPSNHPLSQHKAIKLEAAAEESFVFFTRFRAHTYYDQIIGLCTDAGFSPRISCEASTIYGVLDLVSSELGIAIVPASSVLLATENVTIRVIENPTRRSEMALIQAPGNQDPLIYDASTCMKKVFEELVKDRDQKIG
ncbi:MAG: LysR family transcriptional regulator [Oceanospirillaceae bacterium]|nr:LysR family transcriptional regulator [Oceanospirillaceae bacterium]